MSVGAAPIKASALQHARCSVMMPNMMTSREVRAWRSVPMFKETPIGVSISTLTLNVTQAFTFFNL